MESIKIMLNVGHPSTTKEEYREELEDKVQRALYLIDSGKESRSAWDFIKYLNNLLMTKPNLNCKEQRMLDSMQPIIEKYGHHEPLQDSERKAEVKNTHTSVPKPSKDHN